MKLQIGMDSMLKLLREYINQTGFAVFIVLLFPRASERMTAFRLKNFFCLIATVIPDSLLNYSIYYTDTKFDLPDHARHEEDPGHRLPANVSITLLFLLHI
jgi:hypothetical protein